VALERPSAPFCARLRQNASQSHPPISLNPFGYYTTTMPPHFRQRSSLSHPNSVLREEASPPRISVPPSNDFIDLTNSPPASPPRVPQKRARESTEGGPSAKRKKQRIAPSSVPEDVPIIDLDDEDPIAETLEKQRAEQVLSQNAAGEDDTGPQTLRKMSCVICLEAPTTLTVTACGSCFFLPLS
jgi:hypothetical protein